MKEASRWLAGVALLTAAVLLAGGCGGPKTEPKGSEAEHAEKGPHDGALAEWGKEEYHAEFLADHDKQEATVYILDGEAKKAVPIKAKTITVTITNLEGGPVKITLQASPQQGESEGSASRFAGKDEKLKTVQDYKGQISADFDGKHYDGDFDEKGGHKH